MEQFALLSNLATPFTAAVTLEGSGSPVVPICASRYSVVFNDRGGVTGGLGPGAQRVVGGGDDGVGVIQRLEAWGQVFR
jgi:hypothetical protein